MAVSDELGKLATRAKEAEDRTTAAQAKAKADLEQDVENARATAQDQADGLRESAEQARGESPPGGTTYRDHGTSTSPRRGRTSKTGEPTETPIGPRRMLTGPKRTRRSRSPTRMPRSTKPSTPCSMPPWRGRTLTKWRRHLAESADAGTLRARN
jgi:hypothetical protein